MDTFSRIRTGIGELKKEKEDLSKRYQLLSGELGRIIENNTKEIRLLNQKLNAHEQAIAAEGAKISKIEDSVKGTEGRLSTQISALNKQSGSYRDAMSEIGQRIQHAQGTAEEALKGLARDAEGDRAIIRNLDALQKRIGSLESVRERIAEISKSADVLSKGVSDLEKLRGDVAAVQERMASMDASFAGRMDLIESRLTPDINSLKSSIKTNLQEITKLQASIEKAALDIQGLKKDMAAEEERIARVRESSSQTRKRLEMLGTLQTKIKGLEELKSDLFRGVESLKAMSGTMAALQQKTRDLDARLTNADRALEAKVLEKGGLLEKMISEKTATMESQMQERLRFLEANLTEKGKTTETRLAESGKQLEITVTSRLADMGRLLNRQAAGTQSLKGEMKKARGEIGRIQAGLPGIRAGVEEARKSAASGAAAAEKIGTGFTGMKLDVQSLKKDTNSLGEKLKALGSELSGTSLRVSTLDKAQTKLAEIEKLQKSLAAELREAMAMQAQISELGHGLDTLRTDLENRDAVLATKIDHAVTSLKKELGFSSAAIRRIDSEVKKHSLEAQSLRKDVQAGMRALSKAEGDAAQTQKKLGEIEKIQTRLAEMEQSRDALGEAMESQLEDRLRFLDTSMKQRVDNMEAAMQERFRAMLSKMGSDVSSLRKEASANAKSAEAVKGRLDLLARIDERLSAIDAENAEIRKGISPVQSLKASLSENSERIRSTEKQMSDMRSLISRDMAEIRGLIDSAKTEKRDKFDAAVKAFLTSRAEINGNMTALNVKLVELEKRIDAFSRVITRIDLLERKADRLSEKGSEIRRDVDKLERTAGSGDEKVVFVDLGEEK